MKLIRKIADLTQVSLQDDFEDTALEIILNGKNWLRTLTVLFERTAM
ncbi:hypothetical protein [Siminovitchia fordii]|nr:hypothetical protein [Siminovitchia fordii]